LSEEEVQRDTRIPKKDKKAKHAKGAKTLQPKGEISISIEGVIEVVMQREA